MSESSGTGSGIAERLRLILKRVPNLREQDFEAVSSLVDAGEFALALDTLCTQIYEYDVELNGESRSLLIRLGEEINVPVAYLLGDPWADKPTDPWY